MSSISAVPKMTLEGLIPLVKNCPQLEILDIPMNVRPFDPTLLDGVCNTKLSHLGFSHSPIKSPLQVFRSLTRMFPNLKSVSYDMDTHRELWAELDRLLVGSAYK
jgi:hypothetical protein